MNEEEFRAYFGRRMNTANSICEEYLPSDAVDQGFEIGFRVQSDGGLLIRTAVDYEQLGNLSLRLFDHGWIVMDAEGSSLACKLVKNDQGEEELNESEPIAFMVYQHSETGTKPEFQDKCF